MSAVLTPVEDIQPGRFPPSDRRVAELRVPPHSVEAETAVLGGLLWDNRAWDRVADLLTDSDFYRYEHRLIFVAVGQLVNSSRPADVITVNEQMQRTGKAAEVGGLQYLNALAQSVSGIGNVRRHAEIVRENSLLRQLVAASDEIATGAFNPQGRSVVQILDEAQQRVCAIGEAQAKDSAEWQSLEQGVVRLLDRIQEWDADKPDYTTTGLDDIDERLDGGMRGGELIVIGARPSMGKTALGMEIGLKVALHDGKPVAVFSMEMPEKQLTTRLMANISRIHLSKLKRPERLKDYDWPSLTEGIEKLRNTPLFINDHSALNIAQVRSKARQLRLRHGKLGAVVVDYLSLMTGTDPKIIRAYQLSEASQGLKNLAKELDCPVIVLQQVKREVEGRTDQMPTLADLKDSGSLEQDADIVMFIHREWKVKPDLDESWRHHAKVSLAKVRDGEPGHVDLWFVGEHQHFGNWPTDQDVPSNKVRVAKNSRAGSSL